MTCEELRDDYDTFALGAEDGPEAVEIRAHLRRDCPVCVPGVRNGIALVSRISNVVKLVDPPARLRKRIMAAVNPALLEAKVRSPFGWSLIWASIAVVLAITAVLLGTQMRNLSELRAAEVARLRDVVGVLGAPDSREVSFGAGQNRPPLGKVIVNRQRGVVLLASNLPQIEPGKVFELWLIPRGSNPIPSGTFLAASDGTGIAMQTGEVPANLATVAVTVENEGGSKAPTSNPIIAANTD